MLDPNNKELIAKQKQLLNKRLGLDVAEGLGITGDEELFKEEDLLTKSEKNVSLTAHVSLNKFLICFLTLVASFRSVSLYFQFYLFVHIFCRKLNISWHVHSRF